MITYEQALKLGQSKSFDPRAEAKRILEHMDGLIKLNCEKLAKDPNAKLSIGLTSATDKERQAQLLPVLNEMVSARAGKLSSMGRLSTASAGQRTRTRSTRRATPIVDNSAVRIKLKTCQSEL